MPTLFEIYSLLESIALSVTGSIMKPKNYFVRLMKPKIILFAYKDTNDAPMNNLIISLHSRRCRLLDAVRRLVTGANIENRKQMVCFYYLIVRAD